jgi:C4-dicarboxylate-specific signal transduction histidine kinase
MSTRRECCVPVVERAELRQEIGCRLLLVREDPTRLLQVVVNVLLNPADACEATGLRGRHAPLCHYW